MTRLERLKRSKYALLAIDLLQFDLRDACIAWLDHEIACAEMNEKWCKATKEDTE